jgi:hypothetical protein
MSFNDHAEKPKMIREWPVALIAFGVVLTVVWAGLLVWLLLHLLHLV